jgi:hypothetical protein
MAQPGTRLAGPVTPGGGIDANVNTATMVRMPATQLWSVRTGAVTEFVDVYAGNLAFIMVLEHQALTDEDLRGMWQGIRERLLRRMTRFVQRLVADGVAHPLADTRDRPQRRDMR